MQWMLAQQDHEFKERPSNACILTPESLSMADPKAQTSRRPTYYFICCTEPAPVAPLGYLILVPSMTLNRAA